MKKIAIFLVAFCLPLWSWAISNEDGHVQAIQLSKALVEKMDGLSNVIVFSKNNTLVLVDLSDFGCAYCKLHAPQYEAWAKKNNATLKVLISTPIGGEHSIEALRGVLAAKAQGKFQPIYSQLMKAKFPYTADNVQKMMVKNKLDMQRYEHDLHHTQDEINAIEEVFNEISPLIYPTVIVFKPADLTHVQAEQVSVLMLNGAPTPAFTAAVQRLRDSKK